MPYAVELIKTIRCRIYDIAYLVWLERIGNFQSDRTMWQL